ncbi:MAG: hypothetical protein FP820_09930 [Sulfurimonas sp.]|nr:hypothetical protein [Sulfurimonas sp.]MBU3939595.1 hypothetical protein [bacterium]MBU4003000.1 hypothetical protein [Pseudomonadota bacterium]
MAYTSDLRIKNIFKDIHEDVKMSLKEFNLEDRIQLRIFDESSEDNKLFEEGGLSFKDPSTDNNLGSNDAGWTIDNKIPLVVVEGTFGTERGQFGDGQLNRFSHSLGVALNGYIGVTYVPFKGESYSKKDKNIPSDIKSKQLNVEYATIHNGMLTGALRICKSEKGYYLVMDPYKKGELTRLIVEATKEYFKLENVLDECIKEIIESMKKALGKNTYASRSKQTVYSLLNTHNQIISDWSRLFTQNYEALTTSQKRDGHGLLGKVLIDMHFPTNGKFYAIFIRLTKDEIDKMTKRRSKEFQYINNHPLIEVRCIDDLIFTDSLLEQDIRNIKTLNLLQNSRNDLLKKLQLAVNKGEVKLKY